MSSGTTKSLSGLNLNPTAANFTPGGASAAAPAATNSFGDYRRVVLNLMERLCMGGPEGLGAAEEIALMVLGSGVTTMDTYGFAQQIRSAAEDMGNPEAREGAMLAYK